MPDPAGLSQTIDEVSFAAKEQWFTNPIGTFPRDINYNAILIVEVVFSNNERVDYTPDNGTTWIRLPLYDDEGDEISRKKDVMHRIAVIYKKDDLINFRCDTACTIKYGRLLLAPAEVV